jgi:hypothetical protein
LIIHGLLRLLIKANKIMDERLYEYLKNEWKRRNLPKYHKYFEEWISNLNENQINYYSTLWLKNVIHIAHTYV